MPLIRKLFSNRLEERLDLEGLPEEKGESWYLPKIMQLVMDITPLLQKPRIIENNFDISAGGYITLFTVPQGKRWTLLGYNKGTSVGSASIILKNALSGNRFTLLAGATGAFIEVLGQPLILDENDLIETFSAGDVNDTAVRFAFYILEEDAF